ncbi:hypothetical protein D7X96_20350 [Corallococcus interemptor]|uniref:Uncharacterized protein n=1 Tax=Corallococcus interemptor TaxID=2316720 RepID=A0A3A8QG97_9BACT|nr:hypothetical protein [Corallococcus interemptor]RKH66978.1 hypothetical protein D7X96_20350 [Corallococcus interemptor]
MADQNEEKPTEETPVKAPDAITLVPPQAPTRAEKFLKLVRRPKDTASLTAQLEQSLAASEEYLKGQREIRSKQLKAIHAFEEKVRDVPHMFHGSEHHEHMKAHLAMMRERLADMDVAVKDTKEERDSTLARLERIQERKDKRSEHVRSITIAMLGVSVGLITALATLIDKTGLLGRPKPPEVRVICPTPESKPAPPLEEAVPETIHL